MPIHEEIHHLVANGQCSTHSNANPKTSFLPKMALSLILKTDTPREVIGAVPCGIYVDGSSIGEILRMNWPLDGRLGLKALSAAFTRLLSEWG